MKLLQLHFENFKGFADADLSFAERMNVLTGVNGAGKSSVLEAVAKMLSWYVRRLVSPLANGNGNPIAEAEIRNGADCCFLQMKAEHDAQEFSWTLAKTRRGSCLDRAPCTDLRQLNEQIRRQRSARKDRYPVVMYYTVHRAVLDIPLRIRKHHAFRPENAYDNCAGSIDFRTFFEWFRLQEDLQNERIADAVAGGKNQRGLPVDRSLHAVKRALEAFLPDFRGWRIRRSPLRMEVWKRGQLLNVDQLSDGEKCLIAMVGDLARRMVIANPSLEDPLQGEGIVMLEEMELHLHPQWQAMVLTQMMKTFPHVQFIVSTHSPLVLMQLNAPLYLQATALNPCRHIAVFALQDGKLNGMLDPETGLLAPGEMDAAVDRVECDLEKLLNGRGE